MLLKTTSAIHKGEQLVLALLKDGSLAGFVKHQLYQAQQNYGDNILQGPFIVNQLTICCTGASISTSFYLEAEDDDPGILRRIAHGICFMGQGQIYVTLDGQQMTARDAIDALDKKEVEAVLA